MNNEPKAHKEKKELSIHGDVRIDHYFWMRLSDEQKNAETPDEQTRKVLNYLHAENDYLKRAMEHTEKLQSDLFDEIIGRLKQDDSSVPVKVNGYVYYRRFEKGQDYPLHCRKEDSEKGKEEIILNEPELAKDHEYFAIGDQSISENNQFLAYSTDTVSRREYTIYVKDLRTGILLNDRIKNTTGGITWANDNQTFFYTKQDPLTLRSHQIYRHKIGTDSSEDQLVYEEEDDTFGCYIYKTKSRKYLMIASYQTLSSEARFLDAHDPEGEWTIVQKRQRNLEYSVDHFGDEFYIVTNADAKNFKLVKTHVQAPSMTHWEDVIPHRNDVFLEGIDIFENHLVITERKNGLTQLKVQKWSDQSVFYIEFDDPAYTAGTRNNPAFDTDVLRFDYSSLTTPNTVYELNMNTGTRKTLKEQEVLGGKFSKKNYASERIFAEGRDGVKIPISIVYKKGFKRDGKAPLLLYGYGSYGYTIDPYFSSVRLSLLDRGFAFAIAHVRGGQQLGRNWYEDGKLLKKKNTFYDFIDCAKQLIKDQFTSPNHLYAQGGSAGGLLMGSIINMEPELWNGAIAGVPFVDVVSTMLDESIPLTTGEFDEWGNPKNEEYYRYMKSYSPYDNIERKAYPHLLITTGYWDSQVQYWEPAKWIAKLRDYRTNQNKLLMLCNMDVGHGGASGRFQRYKEVALEYAFLLDLEGIKE